ncbi:hypothetical protein AVEN_9754-1, partial [Araneus ventricosus]
PKPSGAPDEATARSSPAQPNGSSRHQLVGSRDPATDSFPNSGVRPEPQTVSSASHSGPPWQSSTGDGM